MLQPKKTKFRRQQKGRQKGNAQRGNQLAFGSFGIKALETKWITGRQIEAARIAVTRYMQRQGQIWIRIFPDKPITRKPADVRMGKGKGNPEGFVAPVTPGRIIIEAEGVSYEIAKEALRLAAQKLPITTKFVVRRDYDVTKAQGPLEALDILKENAFNCILSDHKMPDMDGVEFLKRTYDMYPDTIRLLVTAYSDVEILMNAINYAKIYRYIKKPYSPEELLHIVQLALEYYQLKEDNKKLIVDLKDLFSGTINAIMDALDSKDSYTLGRSRRVAFYTSKIIAAMDLNKTEKATIELAALLHDIGMIGVQEEILHKVEKLTEEEREEIRKHVFYSVKILEDIKQLDKVTDIIKYHHEFYNGAGYPFGVKGEEIPLGARIIAIADAYDSLVSFRPYRDGLTPEEALKIIEEKRGEQFDPSLLDIFEKVVDDANKEWDRLNPYVQNQ